MVSCLWKGQPFSEKSDVNKLCAGCEKASAHFVCGRCHCTRYCKRECQRTHWSVHKKHCSCDPLFKLVIGNNNDDSSNNITLPTYRPYTEEERVLHKAYILQTGELIGVKIDDRDGCCQLTTAADDNIVSLVDGVGDQGKEKQLMALMGWTSIGTEVVMGYSCEDSVIYRCLFDDCFSSRMDLEANHLAPTLVNAAEKKCGGKFIVQKYSSDRKEELIAFPKSEIVDIMVWRVFLGRMGLISSRMYRENMRRCEWQGTMTKNGCVHL